MGQEVLVSLAPLYYPDTLVNPDTCLGISLANLKESSLMAAGFGIGLLNLVVELNISLI